METKKQIIDSLFYEAFYFSKITPVSEFEKYNEYAKNFAKSFNRLIKEIDDPDQRKEIIDWCITNDKLLTIEIIATELRDYEANILKRNYGVLKNLFLNEVSVFGTTEKPITTLKDFFPSAETEIVDKIQNEFRDLAIGKEMAILIYLLTKEKRILIIDDNNKNTSSRLHFLRAFTGKDLKRSGGISNFIEGTTGELKLEKTDPSYIKISKRLDKMV